ncbi:seed specific protein Bn15D1B [Musa troglodytarum]|uniref:Seed specific protein Bn15D1B n=1 Tax=Musa troglodytarum TaxID=320322 RepID=A0A9E7E972_9LILI|nr:seed specific protein Bn15D1B [Musa troglodytarum]
MAANLKARVLTVGHGRRLVNHILAVSLTSVSSRFGRSVKRGVHASWYDKIEEVRPSVVPDHAIDTKSDKYWGPHPTTGVFGPAADTGASAAVSGAAANAASGPAALDRTVWYRPLVKGVDDMP